MPEQNQRIKVTKRMLKEGLLRLLKEKDLDKINITELCQEAGINRTTFYRYYELPRDILLEMQGELFEQIFGTFQNPLTANDVEMFFKGLAEHSDLARLLFQNNPDADLAEVFDRIYQSIPGKEANERFQTLGDSSARLLSAYLAGGTYFMVRQWIVEDIPMSPKEVADIALNILKKTEYLAANI